MGKNVQIRATPEKRRNGVEFCHVCDTDATVATSWLCTLRDSYSGELGRGGVCGEECANLGNPERSQEQDGVLVHVDAVPLQRELDADVWPRSSVNSMPTL